MLGNLLIFFHLLGLTAAVGSVIVSDVLFWALEKKERPERIIHTFPYLSKVVWVGLIILIISGIGLVIRETVYLYATIFWIKMFFVVIIIINGLFLNLKVSPSLLKYYSSSQEFSPNDILHLKAQAHISGVISFLSWITAFLLGVFL